MRIRTYEDILKNKNDVIFIDVRTEKEYNLETIPGAYNVPIFTNEERAIIGTTYKQIGPKEATKQGIEFISAHLPEIMQKIYALDEQRKELVFFCARGGMRSGSIVGLLSGLKFNCSKLDFGYKGYREFVNQSLPKELEKVEFITLYGKTGTGKTNILKEIEKLGYDVLDLEGCANHRGSILGQVGLSEQHSQKQFESLVYDTLRHRKTNIIFTEGESRRIGKIIMQDSLYDKLLNSKKIFIDAPLSHRVNIIEHEYINDNFKNEDLIFGLEKLRRYINTAKIDELISLSNDGKYKEIIEDLMINYYDLNYRCSDHTFEYEFMNENDQKCASDIIETLKSNGLFPEETEENLTEE